MKTIVGEIIKTLENDKEIKFVIGGRQYGENIKELRIIIYDKKQLNEKDWKEFFKINKVMNTNKNKGEFDK